MATTKFAIRERVKYGEEWDHPETQEWMEETQRRWIEDFQNAEEDYKEYRRADFAALEELIAINLFGISNDVANRAYRGTCLLRYFPRGQRLLVTKARKKMEEISESNTVINVQVVPIGARMDKDLQRTEGTDEEEPKKEKNKNTGRIVVFRVKDANGNPVFLDANLRKYKTWEKYLSNNKCPQCIYCYPKDGFLRKQTTNAKGEKSFEANDVEFGEPPSCNRLQEIKGVIDKVVIVATPIIAIASFCCPATWAISTLVLTAASHGLLLYGLATQGYQIWDQRNHEEDYGASLMSFITTIGTMVVNMGLNKYLRGVALQNRQLTTLESVVITGFLLGMKGSQVASFVWMTWSLVCKPKLEPMDIISYTVALHNLYSCVTSPWFAGKLLEQIRTSMLKDEKEQLNAAMRKFVKLITSKAPTTVIRAMASRIEGRNGNIEDLHATEDFHATEDLYATEDTERNIQVEQETIREQEINSLDDQNVFLNNKGNCMENEQAREEYNKFREFAQSDEGRGKNTMVDQDGRIIKTVTYMNAELVFKIVSKTGSAITFSNGETMDLLINSQLDIHPRALDQMNRNIGTTNSDNKNEIEQSDMKRMMELTKDYTASTKDDFTGDRQAAMETYLKEIQLCLKKYQMITRLEIEKTITHTKSLTQNETLKNHLDKMTQAEAFQMRTVLEGTDKRILDLALKMATAHDNNNNEISISRLASWVEVAKMELDDFVESAPPEDTLERRKEYYEQLKRWEIEIAEENYQKGIMEIGRSNGLTGEDMQQIAEANEVENNYKKFHEKNFAIDRLTKIKEVEIETAKENYQKRVNMETDKRSGENMQKIEEASEVENNFHDKNFADWNKGDSKEDHFFRSLENETDFNKRMDELGKEINAIAEILNTESLTFSDEVAVYYHVRKHGYNSRKHFNEEKGWNIPEAENNQQYLTTIKNYIFEDGFAQEKFISQDGSQMTIIYDDRKDYWGIAKCPYDADLGREVGQPTVETHFPSKKTSDPAPKPASEPRPTPDTESAPAPAPPKQEDPQNDKNKSFFETFLNL